MKRDDLQKIMDAPGFGTGRAFLNALCRALDAGTGE